MPANGIALSFNTVEIDIDLGIDSLEETEQELNFDYAPQACVLSSAKSIFDAE